MGSYVKLQLESDICDLDKKIAEEQVFLKQKELALEYSDNNVEASRTRLALHQKNRHHMLVKADVVDIKEYRGVLRLLKSSKDEHDDHVARNSELRSAAEQHKTTIEEATRRRDLLKAELAEYGEVIPFRPRAK